MRNHWTDRYLKLAAHVAEWSKDPSTKVGAVIVDARRRVVGMGYNGFPRGVQDRPERYEDRTIKYKLVVHAEANAILNALVPVAGCAIVCTHQPCAECAKLIIQAGIEWVVCDIANQDTFAGRMDESFAATTTMFAEAGVTLEFL